MVAGGTPALRGVRRFSGEGCDDGDEIGGDDRFCEVILIAGPDRPRTILVRANAVTASRQRLRAAHVSSHLLDKLIPIHFGHPNIGNEHVRLKCLEKSQRFCADEATITSALHSMRRRLVRRRASASSSTTRTRTPLRSM